MATDRGANIMPVSKSELVPRVKEPTNDSDEMWRVPQAAFMQAFLPHFRLYCVQK